MRRLIGVLARLLSPAPGGGWLAFVATLALFALGAALALVWIQSAAGAVPLAVLVALLSACAALASWARAPLLRGLALVPLVGVHLFWLYLALALGMPLAWAVPLAIICLVAILTAAALLGAVWPGARFRVPIALPLGIWIAACLLGWQREDGVARCDDYAAARAAGVEIVVPSTRELEQCRAGESLRLNYYPRRIWEDPRGGRLVMTAQRGIGRFDPPGRKVADGLSGVVCEVPFGGEPSCFGEGKAQGLVESPETDRLFVAAWQQRGPAGEKGLLYVLPRTGPLRPLAEIFLAESAVELYYDRASDTVGVFTDEGEVMRPVRMSDGAVLDPVPAPFISDDTRYDAERREGLLCYAAGPFKPLDGKPFLSVAFRGFPFAARPLGAPPHNPAAWLSMVWGCDWDPATRQVYISDATLGLLTVVDYDSGRVLRRFPIGFGMRRTEVDPARGLIYIANFLRGDVVAFDLASGAEVARWFVGRFVRHLTLSRDGQALWATSTLGVVRIPLADLPDRSA